MMNDFLDIQGMFTFTFLDVSTNKITRRYKTDNLVTSSGLSLITQAIHDRSRDISFAYQGIGVGNRIATATAVLGTGSDDDKVASIDVTSGGSGYELTPLPTISFSGGGGTLAAATAKLGTGADDDKVASITVDMPGSGYFSVPLVRITEPPNITDMVTVDRTDRRLINEFYSTTHNST